MLFWFFLRQEGVLCSYPIHRQGFLVLSQKQIYAMWCSVLVGYYWLVLLEVYLADFSLHRLLAHISSNLCKTLTLFAIKYSNG